MHKFIVRVVLDGIQVVDTGAVIQTVKVYNLELLLKRTERL